MVQRVAILILAAAGAANASSLTFIGTPTGVNDGSFYVLPYEVSIDGIQQLVSCYDIYDDVNVGDVWNAQLLSLGQAASTGYFSNLGDALTKYERVAWLDAQTYQTAAQQIGLQYAMWDVFGSYRTTAESLNYAASADVAAANGYAGFDFSRVRFIEQTGGVSGRPGTEQAFVYFDSISSQSEIGSTPESGTVLLAGLGVCAVALRKRLTRKPLAAGISKKV